MRRALTTLVLVAAVLAGGCGQQHRSTATAARPAGNTSTTSSTAPGASNGSGAATTTTAKSGASTAGSGGATTPTTAAGFQTPTTLPESDFRSTAKVSKACVGPGGKEILTVSTRSQSAVAYTALYADGKNHGGNHGGISGPDGKFQDTFVIDGTAPKGQATVYVSITSPDGKHSNATASFNVGC
jgi:hypothetical protein